jgi:SPP1 family predicted phage head-tail adaptor
MIKTKTEIMRDVGRACRTKLIIQQNNPTVNPDGPGTVDNWTDFATWFCKLMLNHGREFWAAQRINPELSGIAQGRYISGVASDMRCKYGDRILTVVGPPIDLEGGRCMELHLKEVF